MDALTQKIIMNTYVAKESFHTVYPWFLKLQTQGLSPKVFIMDGHRMVIKAIQQVWPMALIQRCLYHIQSQGLSWLRTYPKTQAGKDLRLILRSLKGIDSLEKRDRFLAIYQAWLRQYKAFIKSLPSTNVAFKDLKRTMGLLNNALPDMFHYLKDTNIPATVNRLESFYSRLKADFRRHRGLSEKHKQAYLHWYCYCKGHSKTNTF